MKTLIVLFAICALGYGIDHWQELTHRHQTTSESAHTLIIYGTKSDGACLHLEAELNKRGIAYEKHDLGKDEYFHEMTEKLARIGKMGGNIAIPVAEVDGALVEGATIGEITKRLH